MAGSKFLNPYAKMVICALGMALMAYVLYPSIESGQFNDGLAIGRALVFLGFAYLLVQSVRQIMNRGSTDGTD